MSVVDRPESMVDVLERRAASDPDAELVRFGDGGRLGVGELAERSRLLACRLANLAGPGEVVATAFEPGAEQVISMFALARLGAVEFPIAVTSTKLTALDAAAPQVTLVHPHFAAGHDAVLERLRQRTRLVSVGGELPGAAAEAELRPGPLPPPPAPTDPAVVMMTSGTTGRPKGAVLPHFAGVRHARRVAATMSYGPGDVLLNVFPWHHVNVRHAGLLPALASGARLVAHRRFSASGFWDVCRREGVTAFNFMGALVAILARADRSPQDMQHRVRRAYGGPAPAELCEVFAERFGVELLEAYASTELGDVATNTRADRRPGTAGRILPEYDAAIVDDAGTPLPPGRVGHLAVRARAAGVRFLHYIGDDPVAPEWWQWFRTGDLAVISDDGVLQFRGRRADVIRRRGENISAWEVEQVLRMLPGAVDVAAAGVPSELTEEDLLVAVVPAPGARLDPAQVREWCAMHLPAHSVPRHVWIGADLPRSDTGKIRKDELVRWADR
jgi:carnitine-CoA ligase